MLRRINILWLDDDLRPRMDGETNERRRLQTWLRWFATGDRPGQFQVVEARSLDDFARHMKECEQLGEDSDAYIDALLIDIMWRGQNDKFFSPIGFPNHAVVPLNAGAQLLGLMLNADPPSERPGYLSCYGNRKIATLSTLTDSSSSLHHYLDRVALAKVTVLEKNIQGTDIPDPDDKFVQWCGSLRGSA